MADRSGWTFLSNHGHVLLVLARDPSARLRDVAADVGITERSVVGIVADLERAGILTKVKQGRRNTYVLRREAPLRHPVEAHRTVGTLIDLIQGPDQ